MSGLYFFAFFAMRKADALLRGLRRRKRSVAAGCGLFGRL